MKHLSGCKSGFTLLEVVIAITIMASLAYLSAISISNAITAKNQLQTRIDVSAETRTALKVIEKDIKSAFHYNNFNYDLLVEIRRDQLRAANPDSKTPQDENEPPPPPDPVPKAGQPPTSQDGPAKKTVVNLIEDYLSKYKKATDLSQFLGGKEALSFTSLNHVRRFQDAQESDQMEVGYYLAECRELLSEKRSQCLWRRESPFIDKKVDEGGGSSVLMENVTSLTFQYKTKKEMEDPDTDWRDVWRSDESGDAATKGKFPDVVKVSIEAEIKGRKIKHVAIIPIDFVNNKEAKKDAPAQNPVR
ncbi:MAG: prepilin-type N-terminal cleavage/methylation domain-containing protein [Bdellovibrionales bacterium]|nr:prepilin-type N-terminal cleavage/methylation domain-containing protein [Bdellovibrionales bacterium]